MSFFTYAFNLQFCFVFFFLIFHIHNISKDNPGLDPILSGLEKIVFFLFYYLLFFLLIPVRGTRAKYP